MISNTANVAALIYHELRKAFGAEFVNWAGFYLVRPVKKSEVNPISSSSASHTMALSSEEKDAARGSTDRVLMLGAFHGLPAVVTIPFGQGVCGTAAVRCATQLVPDVHALPYHIACDPNSNSEIVVPLFRSSPSQAAGTVSGRTDQNLERELVAVLDMDSPRLGGYTEEDQVQLERIAALVAESCDWVSIDMPVGEDELAGSSCARLAH